MHPIALIAPDNTDGIVCYSEYSINDTKTHCVQLKLKKYQRQAGVDSDLPNQADLVEKMKRLSAEVLPLFNHY